MAFTNAEKSQHGVNAQNNLASILAYCGEKGYISACVKNYRVGKTGYTNAEREGGADKKLDEAFVRSVLNSFYIPLDSALPERA